jgi:MFS family permease
VAHFGPLSPLPAPPSRLRRTVAGYQGLDRRIWMLALVRGINTMGLSLVMAFMAVYLVTERGISGSASGLLYFVANLGQALANGYTGPLSDRVGRRRMMVAALTSRAAIIALLGYLVLAHAPIWILAVVLIVSSSLRGGFEPVASAVVADVAPPDRRVAAFGLQRMGVNLGWVIGPSLGGLLAAHIDYGWVFFCAVPPILLSAVAIARLDEPRTHSVASRAASASLLPTSAALADSSRRPRGELALLLGGALLFSVIHVQLFSTFPVYVASEVGLAPREIGLLYGVNGLAVLLFQVPAVALIAHLRNERALVIGPLLYVIAFVGVGAAGGAWTLGAAVLLLTIGEVVVTPAQQATVAELGDPSRLGRAFGVFGTMQMVGVAIAPLVGGLAYDHLRHRPLLMWACLAALPALLSLAYARFAWLRRRSTADNRRAVWESQVEP